MSESPLSASPYQVLGVSPNASMEELRRGFRKAMRQTHPDTGGDPRQFSEVQRAWDEVGTRTKRAEYDAGRSTTRADRATFTARPSEARRDSRPQARSSGHPGGWRRERYLDLLQEWAGRGVTIDDPYDPALVRSAPREIRHILADALAEEATARTLSSLGLGYTVWHDVSTGLPDEKIDHVVLGPTGLFAMLSEDFGGPVRVRKAELDVDGMPDLRPYHDLAARAKVLSRSWGIRFSALVIVLPDGCLPESICVLGRRRGSAAVAVQQSSLASLMRGGIVEIPALGGTELFDVRTRVNGGVRFV